MTDQLEGQMSLFDLDTWSGKMSPEPLVPTGEKTSKPSSRKSSGSQNRMLPMFLYLKKDGTSREYSWENLGASLGESTMPNIGGSLKDARALLSLGTLMGCLLPGFYLDVNFGEKPDIPNPTKLSEVLEEQAADKYRLSSRACQGILNRAEKRGKQLPEILKQALENQIDDRDELSVED